MQGIIKRFFAQQGYGFIGADCGEDVFVHFRDIQSSGYDRQRLEGQRVEFEIVHHEKGLRATKVFIIDEGGNDGMGTRK